MRYFVVLESRLVHRSTYLTPRKPGAKDIRLLVMELRVRERGKVVYCNDHFVAKGG